MKFGKIILLIIAIVSASISYSQKVGAKAKLDTAEILIGDQINLQIEATIPEDANIAWPFLEDTISSNIEIIKAYPIDTIQHDGLISLKQNILITSFDSGKYTIRPFEFLYMSTEDTVPTRIYSLPQLLKVNTIEIDTTIAIKAIKPPLGAPITFGEVYPWVLIGLGVVGVIWFLIYYLKKRKKKEPIFASKPKPKLPAHVIALNGLEELKYKKLWQNGKFKEYYTNMTDLVREYIEDRFKVQAIEMTTDEIMDSLKTKEINNEAYDKIRQTLKLSDMVKFAKAKPMPLENDISLNNSIDFVNETIKQVEESLSVSEEENDTDRIDKSVE